MNGTEGEIVVPVGAPVTFTVTEPENPFSPVIETRTAKAPPGGTFAELGVAAKVKSGGRGGGPPELPDPQPQPAETCSKTRHASASIPLKAGATVRDPFRDISLNMARTSAIMTNFLMMVPLCGVLRTNLPL